MVTATALFTILLAVAISSYVAAKMFRSKNKFVVKGRTVVITGGSQGLGLAVARQLAAKGANVVIVAQDLSKLEKAINEIRGHSISSSQRFLQLSFDLRSPQSAPEIFSQVTKWNNNTPPDIIFCCAGNCHPGFFADVSIETLRSQMDTIYWSSAYMAHAALNAWTIPSPNHNETDQSLDTRHIVFTCSCLAFLPVAGYSPYSPAKAAMKALVDSLNQEVAVYNGSRQNKSLPSPPADIKVHTLLPMGILSPGFDNENKIKPELTLLLEKDDKPQPSEEVAAIAISRLEQGDFLITTQLVGHLMKGWGMAGSIRSISDVFWNFVGSLLIIFVAPDFISKCRNWGKQKGMQTRVAGK